MKTSRVCLFLGFVLIMALSSHANAQELVNVDSCCSSYFRGKIPPKLIVKVEKTGRRCAKRGFVVTTPGAAAAVCSQSLRYGRVNFNTGASRH